MEPSIRLAIVDDYAVVIAGVASFLADERIDVVETGASLPVISDVDLVLYDTFGQVQGQNLDLEDFVRDSGAKVVIYSWNLRPNLIEQAIAGGASGYLSKVLTGPVIVEALERIMSGEIVILTGEHETSVGGAGDNSVKTYVRTAYRKMGVERRTQAILWGVMNGFVPDIERTVDPALQTRPAVPTRSVQDP